MTSCTRTVSVIEQVSLGDFIEYSYIREPDKINQRDFSFSTVIAFSKKGEIVGERVVLAVSPSPKPS